MYSVGSIRYDRHQCPFVAHPRANGSRTAHSHEARQAVTRFVEFLFSFVLHSLAIGMCRCVTIAPPTNSGLFVRKRGRTSSSTNVLRN